jgi:peptide/nickel transport system ATP-binding protein
MTGSERRSSIGRGQRLNAERILLQIQDAAVVFPHRDGAVRALDGVSLSLAAGETLAVVGESGCGKTTLARAVLGLQPLSKGEIRLQGTAIDGVQKKIASKMGMVWQDPYASLNPRWKVGKSALEPAVIAGKKLVSSEIFTEVGLDPELVDRYPHELSGGQRQRVAIGRALSLKPPLVICDEPTAALDLSIRAQILNLLKDVQESTRCSFFYISHDLTTVRFIANRVAVMYLGRIVEEAATEEIFESPRHPYTKALLESAPSLDRLMRLPEPPAGEIPDPRTKFVGCRYAGRCASAQAICNSNDPTETREDSRRFFCHFPCRTSSHENLLPSR